MIKNDFLRIFLKILLGALVMTPGFLLTAIIWMVSNALHWFATWAMMTFIEGTMIPISRFVVKPENIDPFIKAYYRSKDAKFKEFSMKKSNQNEEDIS